MTLKAVVFGIELLFTEPEAEDALNTGKNYIFCLPSDAGFLLKENTPLFEEVVRLTLGGGIYDAIHYDAVE